ncbi:hypothetical protein HPB50_000644 [Hyalomma asiaticum]|uniref:Uncharacterized protein n=1 Tax=Hyalomma asiaticum TaxID=266040 RepID=A0ACB7TAF8_HYAAI|nr:hypothetical protein HPB50_000644 [Hyalomma asiaticum]
MYISFTDSPKSRTDPRRQPSVEYGYRNSLAYSSSMLLRTSDRRRLLFPARAAYHLPCSPHARDCTCALACTTTVCTALLRTLRLRSTVFVRVSELSLPGYFRVSVRVSSTLQRAGFRVWPIGATESLADYSHSPAFTSSLPSSFEQKSSSRSRRGFLQFFGGCPPPQRHYLLEPKSELNRISTVLRRLPATATPLSPGAEIGAKQRDKSWLPVDMPYRTFTSIPLYARADLCSDPALFAIWSPPRRDNRTLLAVRRPRTLAKARRTLGFVIRTSKPSGPEAFCALYTARVLQRLEYCSSIWNPYQLHLTNILESVQHLATRPLFTRLGYSRDALPRYEARLERLSWQTLQHRRTVARVNFLCRCQGGSLGDAYICATVPM